MLKKQIVLLLILTIILSLFNMNTASASAAFKSFKWSDYQDGGEGVGYHDSSGAGLIEAGSTLGICIRAEEWVAFTIDGLNAGAYVLTLNMSNTVVATLNISLDGNEAIKKGTALSSGAFAVLKDRDIGVIELSGKPQRLVISSAFSNAIYLYGFKLERQEDVLRRESFKQKSRPYFMSYLPCVIKAENFDSGISGEAYHDIDAANQGGFYRPTTSVDIYEKDRADYFVKMLSDEWMKYTFSVSKDGNYNLILNLRDLTEASVLRIFIDNLEVVKKVQGPLPQDFAEKSIINLSLKKGVHMIVFKCMDGEIDLDYMRFVTSSKVGIDITNANLRTWNEAQTLEDEEDDQVIANPVEREFYVKPTGNDQNDGSKEKPFKSIERARDVVRNFNKNMKGDIIVHLEGEYVLNETLQFTKEDSGTNGYNVIYSGGGKTVISGGRKVTGWNKVDNTPLYKAKVTDADSFRQFYINQNRGVRARTQYLYWATEEYDDPNYTGLNSKIDGFVIDGRDFKQDFSRPEELEFVWTQSWKNIKATVDKVVKNDEGNYIVTFKQPYFDACLMDSSALPRPSLKVPFFIENAVEFLDEPGEWYFNKKTKEIFYYPIDGEDMNTAECYIPKVEVLLTINGDKANAKASNITIDGIDFKYGAWEEMSGKGFVTVQAEELLNPDGDSSGTVGAAGLAYPVKLIPAQLQVNYGTNVNITNCNFRHLGSVGVSMNNITTDSKIEGCLFDDTSAAAITLGDWKITSADAPVSEFCRRLKVKNNIIRRVSVEYFTNGITAYYINGSQISHNDILDTPYTSISMGWGWGRGIKNCANNKITYNKIENAMYRTYDGAHIYTLDPQRGTIIANNYLKKSEMYTGGIYLDNGSSYLTIRNNVVEDVPKWLSLNWHNIRDNVAINNYAERPYRSNILHQNSIEVEKGKVNGEWPQEAKDIIAKAGVTDKYKHLLSKYNEGGKYRNVELNFLKAQKDPGIVIPAGKIIPGGEGVAFHEIVGTATGYNILGEVTVSKAGDGTNHGFIMVTGQGEWTKHPFEIQESGEYELFLNVSVAAEGVAASVWIDDELVAEKAPLKKNCTDYSVFDDNLIKKVYLEKGSHVIKVEHAVSNFGFYGIRFAKPGETHFDRKEGYRAEIMQSILKN